MTKESSMTFRVEEGLRERFADAAKAAHRPAAQVLRELMRAYVERAPAHTANAISEAERGRRQEAVDFANANVELEGFAPSEDLAQNFSRFVDGKMELQDLLTDLDARSRRR